MRRLGWTPGINLAQFKEEACSSQEKGYHDQAGDAHCLCDLSERKCFYLDWRIAMILFL